MKDLQTIKQEITDRVGSSQGSKFFAVFDHDGTCIFNDIAEATLNYMAVNSLFVDQTLLPGLEGLDRQQMAERIFRHYYNLLDQHDILGAYELSAKMLSGLRTDEIGPLVEKVFSAEGEVIGSTEIYGVKVAKGLAIRPAVFELIAHLKNLGVAVWVVSASPALLVAEAMKHFGLKAELIGIRQKINNGIVTAELERPLSILGGKVDCIKLFIDPNQKPLLGAGDSNNDLPMLEYSELKAVVDRGNSLATKAKSEGWTLL